MYQVEKHKKAQLNRLEVCHVEYAVTLNRPIFFTISHRFIADRRILNSFVPHTSGRPLKVTRNMLLSPDWLQWVINPPPRCYSMLLWLMQILQLHSKGPIKSFSKVIFSLFRRISYYYLLKKNRWLTADDQSCFRNLSTYLSRSCLCYSRHKSSFILSQRKEMMWNPS